jgi:hypothetical protein
MSNHTGNTQQCLLEDLFGSGKNEDSKESGLTSSKKMTNKDQDPEMQGQCTHYNNFNFKRHYQLQKKLQLQMA